jgi:hypothetical protein
MKILYRIVTVLSNYNFPSEEKALSVQSASQPPVGHVAVKRTPLLRGKYPNM